MKQVIQTLISLLFIIVANIAMWKWIIPFFWHHQSSAAFDTALWLSIIDIAATVIALYITYSNHKGK